MTEAAHAARIAENRASWRSTFGQTKIDPARQERRARDVLSGGGGGASHAACGHRHTYGGNNHYVRDDFASLKIAKEFIPALTPQLQY